MQGQRRIRLFLLAAAVGLGLAMAPSAFADNTTLVYNASTYTTTLTDDDSGSQIQLNQLSGTDCPDPLTICDKFSSYSGNISTTDPYCVDSGLDSVICNPADYYVLMGTGAWIFAKAAARRGANTARVVFAEGRRVEEIFETIVCAAVGQASRQYEGALAALAAAMKDRS